MSNANKKDRRSTAVVAVVAGVALLFGGSTYALWSASDTLDGGQIISGDLDLTAGEVTAWDVSADRLGDQGDQKAAVTAESIALGELKGHLIESQTDWRYVPGDTVALAFPYQVTLEGDNLVAMLTLPTVQGLTEGDMGEWLDEDKDGYADNLSFTYQLFNDGVAMTQTAAPLELPQGSEDETEFVATFFQATNTDQAAGQVDGSIPMLSVDGTSEWVTFVLYVTFDGETPDRVDTAKTLTLSDAVTASLQQVRCNENLDSITGDQGLFTAVCQ